MNSDALADRVRLSADLVTPSPGGFGPDLKAGSRQAGPFFQEALWH